VNDLFDVAGKTVLITGGARGLGRMIAEGFVRAGAKVYVTSRDAAELERAVAELSALGMCIPLLLPKMTAENLSALAVELACRESRLHVLVNNAGRTWGAPLDSFPDSAWADVFAVNVQAPFTLTRALLPLLTAAATADDPARVLNIGSLAGAVVERLNAFSYASSKAALHHLSRELAAELAPRHITVNLIAPGYFETRMTSHIRADETATEKLLSRVPLGRFGRGEDVAGACLFLASRAGSYMTGSEIFMDGGLSGCR
jgi:NAD(P)-dependent dehydrogenase (short-subunit alcohol dehydrogenase family)